MRTSYLKASVMCVAVMVTLLGVREGQTQPPPVAAPIVREGSFAVKLAEALNVGHPESKTEAESMLGAAGIAPRNGWIADYPVTPDIIGELRDSVSYAAQAKTISKDKDAALKALEDVQASINLAVSPGPAGPPGVSPEGATEEPYPNETVINNYYYEEGPPILTYYPPPPDYYYLYAWVPYPFWWGGFWFGGFFILHDFHRHFREHGHVFTCTNHFNDVRANRVYRIDPVNRFSGRTFAGIGAPRSNNFIGTGVRRAPERVFNGSRGRPLAPPSKIGRAANPFPANRVYSRPPGAGRTFTAPRGGARGGGGGMRR